MPLPPRIPRAAPQRSAAKADAKKQREALWHVKLVKTLPCCACGKPAPNDPHHLMRGVERGTSMTAAGRYTIPLCRQHHTEITPHGDPEAVLMERYGVDARALAEALWSASPDAGAMQRAVLRAQQDARLRGRDVA